MPGSKRFLETQSTVFPKPLLPVRAAILEAAKLPPRATKPPAPPTGKVAAVAATVRPALRALLSISF